jgi:heat-inducible transcriptional repressor
VLKKRAKCKISAERQKLILSLVIHEYIRTATPVGSNALVARYHLEMSSATVRNEMAFLTELGYLRQPHTSAGRIPSEEGYRFFVSRLIRDADLPDTNRRTISHQFFQMRNDVEHGLPAVLMAGESFTGCFAGHPQSQERRAHQTS